VPSPVASSSSSLFEISGSPRNGNSSTLNPAPPGATVLRFQIRFAQTYVSCIDQPCMHFVLWFVCYHDLRRDGCRLHSRLCQHPVAYPTDIGRQEQTSATSDHNHCAGHHRLVPKPQLQNPNTTVQSHPSKHSPPKDARRPKRYRLGPQVLRPNLPRPPNCLCIMLTVPWAANAACLSDWASELITLLFDQVEDQWKLRNAALHGRDDAEH
jgi:hypothetical protein